MEKRRIRTRKLLLLYCFLSSLALLLSAKPLIAGTTTTVQASPVPETTLPGELVVYNASGVYIRVPTLPKVKSDVAVLQAYMPTNTSLNITLVPLVPNGTTCQFTVNVFSPSGPLIISINDTVEAGQVYNALVDLGREYEYVVLNGTACGIDLPMFAVRYFEKVFTPPEGLDAWSTLFYNMLIYSPLLALAIRTSLRTVGVVILASLPISTVIMLSLGADPGALMVVTGVLAVTSIILVITKS